MLSSSASSPFRLELRVSRWLQVALLALSLLAAFALALSEAPALVSWPLGVAAVGYGLWMIRRERLRPAHELLLPGDGPAQVAGAPVDDFRVEWRGPLAFLSWRDARGHVHRHVLWPDTLPPARRRELRLAVEIRQTGR